MEKSIKDQFLTNYEKLPYHIEIEFFENRVHGICPQVAIYGTQESAISGAAGILYSLHIKSGQPVEMLLALFAKELASMVMPGTGAVDLGELGKMGGR